MIDGRAIVLTSAVELGLASEHGFAAALTGALALALASPASPIEHRRPPLATTARALGALVADALGEPALGHRLYAAGGRELGALATAARATSLFEARLACARALATDRSPRGDDEARDRAAEALSIEPGDVPLELALPLRRSARRDLADARARLTALALVPAVRERYDADFYRNPRFADLVRGAAARGGLLSCEGLLTELAGSRDDAIVRAGEIAS